MPTNKRGGKKYKRKRKTNFNKSRELTVKDKSADFVADETITGLDSS